MQIGKYQVIKQLGAGAMGVVYLAEHSTLSQRVAIKLINAKLIETPTIAERFLNEARAASKVGHPGIVTVHDFDVDPGTDAPFIVMEYLEGRDLTMHLREVGAVDSKAICDIGGQLAEALAAAHAKGIIHRDLKPDNIYLSPDSAVIGGLRVKVLDFGIAKLVDNDVSRMTQGGSVMGTPMYMAPEQALGADKADARSDIYALGCIFYQMATGEPPFPNATDLGDLFRLHRDVMPPAAHTRSSAISVGLSELIESCMAKPAGDRPSSMAALAAQLRELGEAVSTGQPPTPAQSAELHARYSATVPNRAPAAGPAETVAKPRRSPLLLAIGGVAVAVAIVVAIGAIVMVARQSGGTGDSPTNTATDDAAPAAEETFSERSARLNPWIAIAVPDATTSLTVPAGLPADYLEMRPELTAPSAAYEIQQHEVTWQEFHSWYFRGPFSQEDLIVTQTVKDAALDVLAPMPATGMIFTAAFAFCEAVGGRLPTEAEWEWAARGQALRMTPWEGDEPAERATYDPESGFFPPVRSAPRDCTPEGVCDLGGSVFELTSDQIVDPDDAHKLDRYVVIRGANPQKQAPTTNIPIALERAYICKTGSCLSLPNQVNMRAILGFRCVR